MKTPTKFVSKLNQEQIQQLKHMWKTAQDARVRNRAHGIILSSKGYSIDDIVDILDVHRDSVSSWIQAWERAGASGLYDKPRSGAPSKLTVSDKKVIEQLLKKYPHSPKTILAKFAKTTSKTIGISTLKRVVKKSNLCWKRARKSLKKKMNQQKFEVAKKEIQKLKKQQQVGKIDWFYFDESGFSLDPIVPYAYQPIGETLEIPATSSSKRLNVLGFYSIDNLFESFGFEGKVDSSVVVACFNEFCQTLTKKTVVIIDNASIHTSDEFKENIPKWKSKNLILKYLPPYSPELNLVEIVRCLSNTSGYLFLLIFLSKLWWRKLKMF